MTAAAVKQMSIADFLAWADTQETGRYELFCGKIVGMAPERAEHVKAKARVWRALADAVEHSACPCEAYTDGLGVAIDEHTVYEPDALVNCGGSIAPDALLAPSPVIIVEVASPSTHTIDKSIKLADYFRLPSLAHYLIVDLGRRLVLHYRRGAEGPITVSIVREGAITLDPPGLTIELSDIFD